MAFLLLVLISATWLLGLMAVNSDVMTFHYLFAVFSCLQVSANPTPSSGCTDNPHTLQKTIHIWLFTLLSNTYIRSAFFSGSLHFLVPRGRQQRGEEKPQEHLQRKEEHTRRVQHHKGLFANSKWTNTYFIYMHIVGMGIKTRFLWKTSLQLVCLPTDRTHQLHSHYNQLISVQVSEEEKSNIV